MKYYICNRTGHHGKETIVVSASGKLDTDEALFSAAGTSPEEIVIKWIQSQGQTARDVVCEQRSISSWDIVFSLMEE